VSGVRGRAAGVQVLATVLARFSADYLECVSCGSPVVPGAHWSEHVTHYSLAGLRALADSAGMSIVPVPFGFHLMARSGRFGLRIRSMALALWAGFYFVVARVLGLGSCAFGERDRQMLIRKIGLGRTESATEPAEVGRASAGPGRSGTEVKGKGTGH
jgi:hypothetical protein